MAKLMVRVKRGADKQSELLFGFAAHATVHVEIQFNYSRHGLLSHGVGSKDGRAWPEWVKSLIQALMGSGAGTQYWPVSKRDRPNDRRFPLSQQFDRKFWISARDGQLAGIMIRFVEKVETALRRADLLKAVRARVSGGVGRRR